MDREYILKHREIPVILFTLNDDYELSEMGEFSDEIRLPFGLKYSGKSNAQYKQLADWIEKRGLPQSRSDLVHIKRDLKARNSTELALGSYALNLTDHYWVHKSDIDLKWKDVNFFDNGFIEAVSFDIEGIYKNEGKEIIAPDLTVDGSLRKKWVLSGNERYLLKSSRYDEMQEPFNEVIASKIMDVLGIDHVQYELARNESDNMPLSICKCMVDRNTEFITAQTVMDMELKNNRNEYARFIEICGKNGIKDAKKHADEMIILDCIVGNTDRHTGNFGIIRNADTLEWIRTVPIFDNGNSLCHDIKKIDDITKNIDSDCRWFPESNFEKLRYIDFPEWYSASSGKKISTIVYNELQCNENMNEDKRERIAGIVDIRMREIEEALRKQ